MHDNKLIVGDQKNFGAKTYATVPYKKNTNIIKSYEITIIYSKNWKKDRAHNIKSSLMDHYKLQTK